MEIPVGMFETIRDLYTAVEELHSHSSQEMNKLLEVSDNLTLHLTTRKGSSMKVDMGKVAWHLPLHLLAVLISSNGAELSLQYLLCGVRLLHSLGDLASQHAKLEQDKRNNTYGQQKWPGIPIQTPLVVISCANYIILWLLTLLLRVTRGLDYCNIGSFLSKLENEGIEQRVLSSSILEIIACGYASHNLSSCTWWGHDLSIKGSIPNDRED
eukprot:Gb_38590 [translate_table: standard]